MALKNPFKKPNDIEAARADIERKVKLLADAEALLTERKSAAARSAEAGAGDDELRPLVAAEQEAEKLVELRSRGIEILAGFLEFMRAPLDLSGGLFTLFLLGELGRLGLEPGEMRLGVVEGVTNPRARGFCPAAVAREGDLHRCRAPF